MQVDAWVNVLMDWNGDGMWGGSSQCPTGAESDPTSTRAVAPACAAFSSPSNGRLVRT